MVRNRINEDLSRALAYKKLYEAQEVHINAE